MKYIHKKTALNLLLLILSAGHVYGQWKPVPINLATIYLNSIDSESVIVKVNENDFYRIFKNTNKWQPINTNFISASGSINSFAHYKTCLLFVSGGQNGKVFISNNNGLSYDSLKNFGESITFPKILINSSNGRIYLNPFTGIKLKYSEDQGNSWNVDTLGLEFLQFHQPESISNIDSLEFQKANSRIYYRSILKKEPWKLWINRVNNISQLYSFTKHQDYFLAATSSGIYKFMPADSTWVRFDQNSGVEIISGGLESLGRFIVFSGINKGIYISSNEGASWTHLPLDTSQNKDFRIKKFDNKILAFTNTGVFVLDTNTFSWDRFGDNLMGLNAVDIAKVNNHIIASSSAFGITETNLQGEYQNTLPKHNAKALYHIANKIYVATNLGIKQKDIGSNNWQNIHPAIDNQNFLQILLDKDSLYCLSKTDFWVKPLNDTSCIRVGSGLNVSTSVALVQTNGNFYAITNGTFTYAVYKFNRVNTTWEAIANTLPAAIFNDVCHYKGNLLLATNMGLHQYNPIDYSWTEITATQKLGNIKAIQSNENALVLYSENMPGVYFCNDTSYNFHPISGDLPSMNITKFHFQQDTLFIGGSKGIWFRPLSQLASSINLSEPNLNEISIYPNPFTESIHIEGDSKNLVATELQVMDMQGRTILHKAALQLPYVINLQSIEPGLYFLKLGRDSMSTTKRILKL